MIRYSLGNYKYIIMYTKQPIARHVRNLLCKEATMPCRTIYWERDDTTTGAYDRYVRNKAAMRATKARIGAAEYERLKQQCSVEDITLAQEAAEDYELWSGAHVVRHFANDTWFPQCAGNPCTCLKVILSYPPVPGVVGKGGE